MASKHRGFNRRTTYRFPVTEPWLTELVVGDRWHTVQVLDESTGGLGVSSSEPLELKQGDLAKLRTRDGWFEVRAVRVEVADGVTLLGLQRLDEISMTIDPGPSVFRRLLGPLLHSMQVGQMIPLVLGILLAAAVVAVPVLLRNWDGGLRPDVRFPEGLPRAKGAASGFPGQLGRQTAKAINLTGDLMADGGKLLVETLDVRHLLDSRTIRRLAISPEQERNIRALVASLEGAGSPIDAGHRSAVPLVDGLREILTERQQLLLHIKPSPKDLPNAEEAGSKPAEGRRELNALRAGH